MRVCMISPHLPPEQGANALLPVMLGHELVSHGVDTSYVAHRSIGRSRPRSIDHVVYVPRRGRGRLGRTLGGAVVAAGRMALGARRSIGGSDLVHLHSNGLIVEVGCALAKRYRKPHVITLYGTDVWHHDPARHERFGRVVRDAACRVFYSQGLLDFAKSLGLAPDPSMVIHAPVPPAFRPVKPDRREALRRDLRVEDAPLLLTVKRLHPVGGHEDLLRAVPAILRKFPGAQLWFAGDGGLRPVLEALAIDLGIASHVRFLGRVDNDALWRCYAAADLFVLPSRLESWGTVMLEALACGTPVVATDTAGAREVQSHFPADVALVERENPQALAEAVCGALGRHGRTGEATQHRLRAEFSVPACAERYLAVYRQAVGSKDPALDHGQTHAV
jgi:glycosyltransferase involved in cell wall biosynthesis